MVFFFYNLRWKTCLVWVGCQLCMKKFDVVWSLRLNIVFPFVNWHQYSVDDGDKHSCVCVLHVSGGLIVSPDFLSPFFLKLIRIQNKQVAHFCTYQLTVIDFWNFDVGTCLEMFPIILAGINPLLHWNVWPLLFHSQDLPPAHLCLCVEVGVESALVFGGRHYKLSMRGLGAPWPLLQTHTQHGRLDYDH